MDFIKSIFRILGGGNVPVTAGGPARTSAGDDVRRLTYRNKGSEEGYMAHDIDVTGEPNGKTAPKSAHFLGSLKDALVAAGRDETAGNGAASSKHESVSAPEVTAVALPPPLHPTTQLDVPAVATSKSSAATKSAAEAAREARVGAGETTDRNDQPTTGGVSTTRAVKPDNGPYSSSGSGSAARTQLVRGKKAVERGTFSSDPVVGWLVIVGGPGIGEYRPIFEGNNAIGRGDKQRIPLNFGDTSISSEEQAYIRYDSGDRSFLFVPNLAKTNVVSVNNKRPTGAVELVQMDVITMGRTQLVFVPFCGSEFDWAELVDAKD